MCSSNNDSNEGTMGKYEAVKQAGLSLTVTTLSVSGGENGGSITGRVERGGRGCLFIF